MASPSTAVKPDVAIASRASELFRIEHVAFAEVRAKLLGRGLRDGALAFDTAPVAASYAFEPERGVLHVVLPFQLALDVTPEGAQREALAEVVVVIVVRYHRREGARPPTEEEAAHYAGVLGFLHAWPYVRAEVQALTTKLGLPPLVLPVVVSGTASEQVTVCRVDAPASPPSPSPPKLPASPRRARPSPPAKLSPAKKARGAKQ